MATVQSAEAVVVPDAMAAPAAIASTSEAAASPKTKEAEAKAAAFLSQEKFHRRFTLPATDEHAELVVTYAIGGLDVDTAPTLLFIGGMYGGRFLATYADHIGKKYGIRVVATDRPGMGDSTPVDPSIRIKVWLETVPVLMRTINAEHVSVAAHSCGVIYALNTVFTMPWIMPPSNRKLYLFSPWVSPDHSGMTMFSISSYMPAPLINSFDSIMRFVNTTVMPTVQFSGMLSRAVSAPFKTCTDGQEKPLKKFEREDVTQECYGLSVDELQAQDKARMKAVFAGNTQGANHEGLLCLKKKVAGSWGVCQDYETVPDALDEKMREYIRHAEESSSEAASTAPAHFVVKAFWAETDMMIGKKGEEYFNKCFQRFAPGGEPNEASGPSTCLRYESEMIPDTDHETLCLPENEALSGMLKDILGESDE